MHLRLAAATLGAGLTLALSLTGPHSSTPPSTHCPATDWAALDRNATQALTRWTASSPTSYTFTHRLMTAHDVITHTVTVQAGQVTQVHDGQDAPVDPSQERSIDALLRDLQDLIRRRGQTPGRSLRCVTVSAAFNPVSGAPVRWSWADTTGGVMDVTIEHEVVDLRLVDAAR
ncbi:DUF6174 domain-containing protein [Deinococcus soli (ex Cha et al. 2016)]|uniref:Uncharacterized protein n=2 Tax=Deinococcus soli (ex Cha et al. 2016) TaxID=1309411 RepID=A0AAE4BL08_9DEIO|nr:DUF6174 domain-containing protein [Deinococcus soli (ex Cha et al. 2016)]MDR6218403.1 hypothetical protein [Deinococcus soli (ex Cha et al. 2016)]MDR6329143.1 hypothetical protein [Deinococcus soli (ex Cha et al. 2016)]MDR6751416.1 hypothetical protein [Deinococcus soli (ex Cha et al. 2016)]